MSEELGVCAVKVVVRVRPVLARDFVAVNGKPVDNVDRRSSTSSSSSSAALVDSPIVVSGNKISIDGSVAKDSKLKFEFAAVCDQNSTQKEVFETTANGLIAPFMNGAGNCALISSGASGSGKSTTMIGFSIDEHNPATFRIADDSASYGVIPRVIDEIFTRASRQLTEFEFEVRGSFIEIYNENCFDLLSIDAKTQLELRETTSGEVYFPGARSELVTSTDDVIALLDRGGRNRAVACTRANRESSRGHAIFIVSYRRIDRLTRASITSFLYLADLAGSEKVKFGSMF